MNQTSLSLAKITKPQLPPILHRTRPYEILDERRKTPSLWIVGSAGSGKTTLISGYIASRKLPYLWYQMDRGDGDIATFFHYMTLAAERASDGRKIALPQFPSEYQVEIPLFALRYFESLFAQLNPNLLIVLDNYQEVSLDSFLHDVISMAISAIPPHGPNLFIICREAPCEAFSRFSANRIMTSMGWDTLRLTIEETEAISRIHKERKIPFETVKNLHRVTDGWVAGLILMLSRDGEETGELKWSRNIRSPEIFNYLAREVFDALKPAHKDILLKTALLPHMTSRMAESLTGNPHADRILAGLYRNHLFIEKHFHKEQSYQVHPLLREFLLFRLNETVPENDLRKLRCKAALILDENGQTEAAISLLCDAGYWEETVPLLEKHAPVLLSQGRLTPLKSWLPAIPATWQDHHPRLVYWMGACSLSTDPSLARSFFEKAFEQFEAIEDRTGLLLAWAGIVESIFYGLEHFPLLDRWIRVLEGLMEKNPEFPSDEIEARVVYGMVSALVFRQPHHPQIAAWVARATTLAEVTRDMRGKAYAYTQLIFYHMMMGNYTEGRVILESLDQLNTFSGKDHLVAVSVLAVKACYFLNIQKHGECLQSVHEALAFSSETGVHIMDSMFLGWGAWSAVAANDAGTAADFLGRLGAQKHHRPHENSFYQFLRSQEAILNSDYAKASRHADLALAILKEIGIPINTCMVYLSNAHAMQGLGRNREANHSLKKALAMANEMGSRILQFSTFVLQANMLLDGKNEESGLTEIQKALAFGKENCFYGTVVVAPHIMVRICEKALDNDIEVAYVQDLIQRSGLTATNPESTCEAWPWPIRMTTLGGFVLDIGGKPFSSPGRGPQKTFAMLKAIIAHGENGIRESLIQDALWPDLDGDRAHNVFSTTLHRLRKILGSDKAIALSQGIVKLNPEICWVDARHFSKKIQLAVKGWGKINPGNGTAVERINEALALYKGPFLPDDDEPWLVPIRQRLHNHFLQCIKRLGRYYENEKQLQEAIRCYKLGLEVDPLVENFYERLMSCYSEQGKYSEAKLTFIRCRETLSESLGVQPSKQFQKTYQGIIQRGS